MEFTFMISNWQVIAICISLVVVQIIKIISNSITNAKYMNFVDGIYEDFCEFAEKLCDKHLE